jgi:type I restriction enzyme S subunit
MSLRAYAEYRRTATEWLAEVPAHWTVEPLRNVASFTTGWTPPTSEASSFEDELPWANISDLGSKELSKTAKGLSAAAVKAHRIPLSRRGSLLFSFKLSIGIVSIAERDLYTNEAIATFPPTERLRTGYAYYALPVFVLKNATTNIYGAPMLNAGLIRSARLAVPPIFEQCQIADYLDAQTAKIDALIGKQEQLIETLAERRQAVISHAVTKGLDPSAPMKDSGNDGIGQMPSAWSVRPLKRFLRSIDQGVSPGGSVELADDSSWGVLKSGCVNRGIFADEQHKRLSDDFEIDPAIVVRLGDLLVSRASGSPSLVGSTAIVKELRYRLILSDKTFRLVPDADSDVAYLEKVMNSRVYREQVRGAISGAEGLANNLPSSSLRNFVFPTPPLDQQHAIVAHLDHETSKIDALSAKAREMIDVLKERRQALISAAVTGKIDVRGLS